MSRNAEQDGKNDLIWISLTKLQISVKSGGAEFVSYPDGNLRGKFEFTTALRFVLDGKRLLRVKPFKLRSDPFCAKILKTPEGA
jgi:hypothetical protein